MISMLNRPASSEAPAAAPDPQRVDVSDQQGSEPAFTARHPTASPTRSHDPRDSPHQRRHIAVGTRRRRYRWYAHHRSGVCSLAGREPEDRPPSGKSVRFGSNDDTESIETLSDRPDLPSVDFDPGGFEPGIMDFNPGRVWEHKDTVDETRMTDEHPDAIGFVGRARARALEHAIAVLHSPPKQCRQDEECEGDQARPGLNGGSRWSSQRAARRLSTGSEQSSTTAPAA